LPEPTHLTDWGSRDELKQLGEGQKITVVAWALTARKGSGEKCNCDLTHKEDTDNHIVLVDRNVRNPTLTKDEDHSVTAEFTPRVRLAHPNFTRNTLNHLMFDSAHFFGDPLSRGTDWEVHPILKLEYCKGKTCRANNDKNWVGLDND
jgi:hypothetical protein